MTARERHSDNPTFLLLKALITGQKIFYATSDGNVNKKTVVCSDFTSIADQDGNQIHIVDPNSDAEDQTRDITGDTTAAGGTITVATAFDTRIMDGTAFIISGIRSTPVEVAALQADVDEIPSEANTKTFNATALAAIQSEVEKAIEDGGQTMVITTIATLASQMSFTLTAGSADDDAYNGMIAVVEDVTTAAQKAIGVISNYVGSSKTITLRENPGIFTMAATDKISIKSISPDILNILADTNELQTDWVNGGRLDLILDAIKSQKLEVHDVIIYPVSEHAATTEITDDGTSPAYYADTEGGTATVEGTPNVHWLEDINFEQVGTITVISMYIEFEWEHKTSAGTAYSKIQISRDGGSNWVDLTDSIAETNATYQSKLRAGEGNFVSTIVAGTDQLQFRLVSWEGAGGTSSAKIRSGSYVRITYRKS